jgi:hypothetical protein
MPYALKNDFRQNFPLATWHSETKQWSVALEYSQKLNQWREAAANGDIQEAEAYSLKMTQTDILRTQKAIELAKAKLNARQDDKAEAQEMKLTLAHSVKLLRKHKDEIAALAAEIDFERREKEEKEQEIKEALAPLINLAECHAAALTMARYDSATCTATEIKEWHDAKDSIIRNRNILRNAKLSFESLDYLSNLRHGQSTHSMPPAAWYTLTRYQ